MVADPKRLVRHDDLIPQDQLAGLTATLLGVGAIGRQVAIQLAALGVRSLQLVDAGVVEPSDIKAEGYGIEDLGKPKVYATAGAVWRIHPTIAVEAIDDGSPPRHGTGAAAFCSVGSIAARKSLWRLAQPQAHFWADGRVRGDAIRVLAVADSLGRDYYPATLHGQAESQESQRGPPIPVYTASIASGLMVHQFTRWLRGLAVDRDTTVNLLAGEWAKA